MKLLLQLAGKQSKTLLLVMFLSMASALLTISVIAFIQYRLLNEHASFSQSLIQFFLLLIALLLTATIAQISLHKLGHQFVYKKRRRLVAQLINTDIEQIENIGDAKILASLNTDIRNITIAFVHLPELLYGIILSAVSMAYLAFLSIPLFSISLLMLSMTGLLGFWLINRISSHIRKVREYDDKLYQDYQTLIDGRKELSLNPARAKRYFKEEFNKNAAGYRDQVIGADILNGFAANLANTIVLALIGVNYALALGLGWSSFQVASSFALVILFIRMPLMAAIGALPAFVTANISMKKLASLSLNESDKLIDEKSASTLSFQQLTLQGVTYQYRSNNEEKPFQVGPIDLTITRGELIFIIGGNGSGKSTFARLLTGLYRPHSGEVNVDGSTIHANSWHLYRHYFSAVFSDFHLFQQITDGNGKNISNNEIDNWMGHLEMAHKVSHENGYLSDTRYSQGQRKRLALIMSIAEQRGCILLDEWAADQDPRFRKIFYTQLLPLLKERGITIIAITHDDKYFDCADRVLKMDNGKLSELNPTNSSQVREAITATENQR
ncbi:multidrug ABC transporter permease/ATP-binding protein [Marinomonas sp. C2222]|uniref:Multidrug ABC transporter permease/ATP-binding protein n=1 Tax=Marinomonas sargassi TaxID=2984494 RepID=A0ABT2YNV5_9GAMM|nr:multidrug ABC transporter permease/ATP-binding protein [Marinomonas sargassi]MCV2401571.1 multidrug ABC transporter permease/ATP-binding protein [Marinomonas sargassi]